MLLYEKALDLFEDDQSTSGTINLVFQPGEEGHAGAYHMLQEEYLDKVQAIFGLHVWPDLPTGTIGPILAAALSILALQQIVSRETDPLEAMVIKTQAAVHRCTAVVDFLMGSESKVKKVPMTMAAKDFSFYSQKMAAAFFFIGIRNETLDSNKPLHSPNFVIDEEVLHIGAALHATVSISYLDSHVIKSL